MKRSRPRLSLLCAVVGVAACGPSTVPAPSAAVSAPDPAPPGACKGRTGQPLNDTWTIESGGRQRTVRVHVPASYDPAAATPLVLDLHGYMADADAQQQTSQMNAKADEAGFIALHPNGTGSPQHWNAGPCCGAPPSEVDDVQFIRDLLDTAQARLCIDRERIAVSGYSNGAFMAHRLACELSDRVTAIAPEGGPLLEIECSPTRPVAVVQFHGDADGFVPYGGNAEMGYPAIDETAAGWASRNGCGTETEEVFSRGDTTCRAFVGRPAGGGVTLCTTQGGGHTWPGGPTIPELGKATSELNATDYMWSVFEAGRSISPPR